MIKNISEKKSVHMLMGIVAKLREKKIWLLGVLVLFIALAHSCMGRKTSKVPEKEMAGKPEGRMTFSEADFLQNSQPKSNRNTDRPFRTKQPVKPRNYASEIAVFVYEDKSKEEKLQVSSERKESEKIGLAAGTKIPALVRDTIFSFNVGAPVTAAVTSDILKDERVLIPKDSKFLGEAGVLKSLNRINVHFERLIFPDGTEHRVRALALSDDGSAGIKGKVAKHTDMKVLKAVGETALAGVSLFAGGVGRNPYSMEDGLRMNLAQNLTNEARGDLRDVKADTSITVEGFTPIQVILLDGI